MKRKIMCIGIIGIFLVSIFIPSVNSIYISEREINLNTVNINKSSNIFSNSNYYAIIAATGKSVGLEVEPESLECLYKSLIKARNWHEENIILLLEYDATLENIREAFETMADLVTEEDIFVFSWQGHGSEVPESQSQGNEWSRIDELDLKDEVICPADCRRKENGDLVNYISDDELGWRFSNINAKGMYCIFESCLSGGLVGISSRDSNNDGFIDGMEADNFGIDFKGEIEKDVQNELYPEGDFGACDVNGKKRVVVVSTLPDTLGKALSFTSNTGFPLHLAISSALRGDKIFGKALDQFDKLTNGGNPDGCTLLGRKDNIISAEESFRWAKPLIYLLCFIDWVGLWSTFYLIIYERYVEDGVPNPIASALEATRVIFITYLALQVTCLVNSGHFVLNWPHMIDQYNPSLEGLELPIVELDSASDADPIEIPPLPEDIWYEENNIPWEELDQMYWPQLVSEVEVVNQNEKTVSFNGAGYNGPSPFKFEWDFGDGSFSDEQNPEHTYNEKGGYKVILKVKDDANREEIVNIDVNVCKDKSVNLMFFDLLERVPILAQLLQLLKL